MVSKERRMMETGSGRLNEGWIQKSAVGLGHLNARRIQKSAISSRSSNCPEPVHTLLCSFEFVACSNDPKPVSIMRRFFETNKFLILKFFFR